MATYPYAYYPPDDYEQPRTPSHLDTMRLNNNNNNLRMRPLPFSSGGGYRPRIQNRHQKFRSLHSKKSTRNRCISKCLKCGGVTIMMILTMTIFAIGLSLFITSINSQSAPLTDPSIATQPQMIDVECTLKLAKHLQTDMPSHSRYWVTTSDNCLVLVDNHFIAIRRATSVLDKQDFIHHMSKSSGIVYSLFCMTILFITFCVILYMYVVTSNELSMVVDTLHCQMYKIGYKIRFDRGENIRDQIAILLSILKATTFNNKSNDIPYKLNIITESIPTPTPPIVHDPTESGIIIIIDSSQPLGTIRFGFDSFVNTSTLANLGAPWTLLRDLIDVVHQLSTTLSGRIKLVIDSSEAVCTLDILKKLNAVVKASPSDFYIANGTASRIGLITERTIPHKLLYVPPPSTESRLYQVWCINKQFVDLLNEMLAPSSSNEKRLDQINQLRLLCKDLVYDPISSSSSPTTPTKIEETGISVTSIAPAAPPAPTPPALAPPIPTPPIPTPPVPTTPAAPSSATPPTTALGATAPGVLAATPELQLLRLLHTYQL